MKLVIIGNGILALASAYSLLRKDKTAQIKIVGPKEKKGSASLAAAAMFNSYCELEPDTLSNRYNREKWLLNQSANPLWPSLLQELKEQSGLSLNYGFGTFLINNALADFVEDENYQAIIKGLDEFDQEYQEVEPRDIPNYCPEAQSRALKAVYIKNEGWVNPHELIAVLEQLLEQSNRVEFIDGCCDQLQKQGSIISSAILKDGIAMEGDQFLIACGAGFTKLIDHSDLDIDFPKVFYGIGYTLALRTAENTPHNCIRTPNRGLACGTYMVPQGEGISVLGASSNIMPWPEYEPRITSVYSLMKSAMEQINTNYYNARLLKTQVGWRPLSEDTLPLLGKCDSLENLFITTGTHRDGLHCSPVISDAISDLILDRVPTQKLSPLFQPERNAHRIYSRDEAIEKFVKHTIDAHYQHDFRASKDALKKNLRVFYTDQITKLHNEVGANDWGIPVELYKMYKHGHIS